MMWFCLAVLCLSAPAAVAEEEKIPAPAPEDMISLEPYLLVLTIVPTTDDEVAIGSGNATEEYAAWREGMKEKLKQAYEQGNILTKEENANEPVIKIEEVVLVKVQESRKLKIKFYVTIPPNGPVAAQTAELVYKNLDTKQLWEVMDREELDYPQPVGKQETGRTFSIIAFVMGWVCLAALVVILAYLGIKYRDGIKSLARRIEHWSNPNRNGYSNLGGEVHVRDWRDSEAPPAVPEEVEEVKPKKKLRAPGGLLTDVDEVGEAASKPSYGTYTTTTAEPVKDSSQVRLSELATNQDQEGGGGTPPLTPTSMQKHLIKKYQDKQVEQQGRGEDPLSAAGSEVFPDDFADCVEEEEIFQLKP